ncbi:MAG TPA: protein kinase, partial [Acidimicrobiales bacterium]|nr:protein kinase [Acidimicrobiales bacterium]
VWEAMDEVLTRPVAVKILLPHLAADTAFVTRFRHEAVSAARLSDPHIVSIYDTCSDGDVEAIVMELVRGTTLRRLLDEQGSLPPRRAADIAVQVASALEHAHLNGLIHRDVKPGNILLSDDGRVMVADFGIAKAAEGGADLTEVGQVVGTAKYLSPEQVEGGPLDARSDVYALGVVLYEMVCGRPPFSGDNATTTAVARLTSEPLRPRQVRAGIPRGLEQVVLRAMARRPGDRHASAAELRSALEHVDLGRADTNDATVVRDATAFSPAAAASRPGRATTPRAAGPGRRPNSPSAPSPGFPRTERAWLVPAALIVVVAVTLGVVGVLFGRTQLGGDLFDSVGNGPRSAGPEGPVAITGTASFDPFGSGGEHDEELSRLLDNNPDTAWTTEEYNSPDLGGLKQGVGVVLTLAQATALDRLEISSPTEGWAASVYVADRPATTLAGWGEAVATEDDIGGDVSFDLGGASGEAVLVWITHLGEGRGSRFSTALGSVTVVT